MLTSACRVDSLALQLSKDIKGSSALNAEVIKGLRERTDMIANAVDSDSALFKQLVAGQEMCNGLKLGLESVAPKLCDLTESIGRLDEKEDGLAQQLGEIAKSFSDSQVLEKPPLESEAADQSARDRRQHQLDEISTQLSIAQANLAVKETENDNIRNSLSEATAQTQAAEERAMQLESEVAALQGNANAIELKVREELNRASVISRDHIKAKFEQQLHNSLREKMETERELERANKQLAGAQQSLVSFPQSDLAISNKRKIETEATSKHQKDEIELLVR